MAQAYRNRLRHHFSQLSAEDYRTAAKFRTENKKKRIQTPTPIFAWFGVLWIAVILAVLPWMYGGATWNSQLWLLLAVLPLGLYTLAVNLFSPRYRCHVPFFSWLLLALTGWALIQGVRFFDSAEVGQGPHIVQLQRWFLGYPEQLDPSNYGDLMQKALAYDASKTLSESAFAIANENSPGLAISTAPSITFAAAGCLLCAAILIWSARTFFRTHSSISLLLGSMVASGLIVFFFGISKRVSYDASVWNISGTIGDSIGLFISRNSAGAFLNVAFAAALGLIFHFHSKEESKYVDRRYRLSPRTGALGIVHQLESAFAKLTTLQIAIFVVCLLLSIGIIVTYSRGAIASWGISLFLVLFVVNRVRVKAPQVLLALILFLVAGVLLTAFELDDRLAERIQQTQEDLKNTSTGRRYIWEIAAKVIGSNFVTGTGLGSFRIASLPYQTASQNFLYAYSESIYLQSLAELGLPMLMIWVVGIIALGYFYLSSRSRDASSNGVFVASAFAICSQLIHGNVDFAVILPAVFAPLAVVYGATLAPKPRLKFREGESSNKRSSRKGNSELKSVSETKSTRTVRKLRSGSQDKHRRRANLDQDTSKKGSDTQATETRNPIWISCVCLVCVAISGGFVACILPSLHSQSVAEQMAAELKQIRRRDYPFVDWNGVRAQFTEKSQAEVLATPELATLYGEIGSRELRQAIAESRMQARDYENAYSDAEPILQILIRAKAEGEEREDLDFYGGQDNLDFARKHQHFLTRSIVTSPMNWQLQWLGLKSTTNASNSELLMRANRIRVLVQFSSVASERLYWLTGTLGDSVIASQQLEQTLKLDARRIFPIFSAKLLDRDVELDYSNLDLPINTLERLADNYLVSEQFSEANRQIWEVISSRIPELDSMDSYRLYLEGRLYARAGNFVKAVKSFEAAALQAPREIKMRVHLIQAWQALARYDKMEFELDRAEQQFPKRRFWTNFRRDLNKSKKRL